MRISRSDGSAKPCKAHRLLFNSCDWCISIVAVPGGWSAFSKMWQSNLWSSSIDTLFVFYWNASSFRTLFGVQQEKEPQKVTAVHRSYGALPHPQHHHSRRFHLRHWIQYRHLHLRFHCCLHSLIGRAGGRGSCPVRHGYHGPYWTGRLVS